MTSFPVKLKIIKSNHVNPLEMVLKASSKLKKKYIFKKIYKTSARKVRVCGI